MTGQLIETVLGILLLVGILRLWITLGRHSSREDVRRVLGEALALKSGQRLSDIQD